MAILPVSDETIIYTVFTIMWCIIAFPFTMVILDILLRQKIKAKIIQYNEKTVVYDNKLTLGKIKFITLSNTIFLLLLIYLLPVIPLFHVGSGSDILMEYRLKSAFDLPGYIYMFRRLLVYFLPIFFLYLIAVHSTKKIPLYILLINFLNAAFILVYSTEKAPILFFIIAIIFIVNITSKKFTIDTKKILFLFIILTIVLLCMVIFFYNQSINDGSISLVNRLFISQIAGSYLSMEYYGSKAPFKYFHEVFFRLDALFGNNVTMPASEELVYYYYPTLYNDNLWRNVNSFIIQGAWANFGFTGIILAPIWCATIIYFCVLYIVKSPKRPAMLAIYSYSSIFMVSLSTNFNNFI
ncbi:oligosaccharide repeat unit polymerase, partial [Providencia rettgeri]|nr:oligosaccharide repeat unit polymerase [Providencia rettgeri]